MTKDCFGTCPKCGEIGWCHYKGKARIFKSGPGSGTYKVSLFKCGNCGKKFGFELEDGVMEPKDELDTMLEDLANDYEEEDNDWEKITEILDDAYEHLNLAFDPFNVSDAMQGIGRALNIAGKHGRRDS